MGRILKTPDAELDLIDIWLHISEDNPRAADRLWSKLEQTLLLLSDNPGLGPARPELAPSLRSLPLGNYLILYRPLSEGDGISVIRVVHGARDLPALFRRSAGR
jgi:toxin ParE1/3/4